MVRFLWAFEKEGYAELGILGNNSVSGYPSTTGISAHKKGSIEKGRSSIHPGKVLKLRYIPYSQATGLYCKYLHDRHGSKPRGEGGHCHWGFAATRNRSTSCV